MSTISSGKTSIFLRLKSMVRPGFRVSETPLAWAALASFSWAIRIASLAKESTWLEERGVVVAVRLEFERVFRKLGTGGGGFDTAAAATARRAITGLSGNPLGRSIADCAPFRTDADRT